MKAIIAAVRRLFHILTPFEAEVAERGAADAYRDVFDPPDVPNMRPAYERGWWHVQCGW